MAEVVPEPDDLFETDTWMVRYRGEQLHVETEDYERTGDVLQAVADHLDADLTDVNLEARVTEPLEGDC